VQKIVFGDGIGTVFIHQEKYKGRLMGYLFIPHILCNIKINLLGKGRVFYSEALSKKLYTDVYQFYLFNKDELFIDVYYGTLFLLKNKRSDLIFRDTEQLEYNELRKIFC